MDIRPLHTEDDYRAALAEVAALVDLAPKPGTPKGDRLEILSILIEHYTSHQAARAEPISGYNDDFIRWAEAQATILHAGRLTGIDRDNIAEELKGLARAVRRELVDRLARLLQHLLQWHYLDGLRLPAWYAAIELERAMIPALLNDAPSLARQWPEFYAEAWERACEIACSTTGLSTEILPAECPYSRDCALDVTFWPGRRDAATG
jgi:hypothetical protein